MNTTKPSASRPLVIVESPNKVKTISKILGDEYVVAASYGHIADIPAKKDAIDVAAEFRASYVLSPKGKEVVADLRRLLTDASELILATDDDREGEMIAYLLLEFLQPSVPVSRIVFNAITRKDILSAMENRQSIRHSLVEAARTRRYLDFLFGFNVSPVLWKKVRGNLGAGRVQSPALRLVVDRERERLAFVETTFCGLDVTLAMTPPVTATLRSIDSVPVATSSDIDDSGVVTPPAELLLKNKATDLESRLNGQSLVVTDSAMQRYTRKPRPPYTTTSLIQDIINRLKISSSAAQTAMNQLHEKGLISYPRTDSPWLSPVSAAAARQQAVEMFGASIVLDKQRVYSPKNKTAQEAHEAIRPADFTLRNPKGLTPHQAAIYDLVWKRTVASQMIDTVGTTVTVTFASTNGDEQCVFTASGTTISEPGHRRLYSGFDEDDTTPLATFTVGDSIEIADVEVKEHTTRPPARYTEGTLIQALESLEIGRPSTYVPIIKQLRDEYLWSKRGEQALIPTLTGIAVEKFLSECFPSLVDYEFTSQMESQLDDIVNGKITMHDMLTSFYSSGSGDWPGLTSAIDHVIDTYTPAEHNVLVVGVDPVSGDEIVLKPGKTFAGKKGAVGSRGQRGRTSGSPYLSCNGKNAGVPDQTELSQLTVEYALSLLNASAISRVIGTIDGDDVVVKVGPYGPYVQVGKRSVSLPEGTDLDNVRVDMIQPLLEFPRVLGVDPESGADIVLKRGRYGIYVDRDGDTRPVPKDLDPAQLTVEGAVELLSQPKKNARRKR